MRTTYLVCYIIVQFANCTITFCVLDPIMAILAMVSHIIFLLTLPVVTNCYPDQRIYVDNQTGVNNHSCWEGGYSCTPCLSLNLALKGAQHYNHSITILLQPGHHQLHHGSETQLSNSHD